MKLRAPCYPLITVDPYFSVWSKSDKLYASDTIHWTDHPVIISGIAVVDGKEYRCISKYGTGKVSHMKQVSADMDAFSTTYVFEDGGIRLTMKFTTAAILGDLRRLSRPVSYLEASYVSVDGHRHNVSLKVAVSEQICTNEAGDDEMVTAEYDIGGLSSVSIGRKNQKILNRSGDDLRIEWGYFYLTGNGKVSAYKDDDGLNFVSIEAPLNRDTLITFAYDDVECIEYFGKHLKTLWNRNGEDIKDEILAAHKEYGQVLRKCGEIADRMFIDAVRAGGEKYAELCELAYRQSIGAHKVCLDDNGEVLFISKECYSNGCAATVDVSYPSIPLYLIYNPELVKGMMRPIYRFASSEYWKYDFAPHDAGRYPILNGQVYGLNTESGIPYDYRYEKQMPVEECGNMLVMEATVALAENSTAFANEHMEVLDQWVKYLVDNGRDPENQLCTDDFAGHLAHNCNLSLKAIMGIAGYAIIKGMNGDGMTRRKYMDLAKSMAKNWMKRASNGDGSYRLAFDKPGTFSLKYNIVWDKLFGTGIMPLEMTETEIASYRKVAHPYGIPLDNRKPYSKSDWIVWTATLAQSRDDFEEIIAPMWLAYNTTEARVPMTDWYWTLTGEHKAYMSRHCNHDVSFRNRTVVGGVFMKLLEYRGILKK